VFAQRLPSLLALPLVVLADSSEIESVIPRQFLVVGLVCVVLAVLASLCVTIAVAWWMYRDATARGQNGILWAFIGVFGGVLGIIVWLIVRPDKPAPAPTGPAP
jgi:hypothetical protein